MKRIIIRFNSISKVQRLKKLMKRIYSKGDNQIKDIAKFTLRKNVIPQNVDHAEIEINTKHDSRVIHIAKEDLSFMYGNQKPFAKISNDDGTLEQYIILPWNLGNPSGRDLLRDIISNITSRARSIKYTIYVRLPQTDSQIQAASTHDETSIGELSLSELSYGGEMEQLLEKIEMMEQQIQTVEDNLSGKEVLLNQRQNQIDTLTTQLSQRTTEINNLNTQLGQTRSRVDNLNTQLSQRQSQINSLNSQLGNRNSDIRNLTNQRNNLQAQVNNANRTPVIKVNAGPVGLVGNRTSGSFGFNNALVAFDFNNRTINVTSPSFSQTHATLI